MFKCNRLLVHIHFLRLLLHLGFWPGFQTNELTLMDQMLRSDGCLPQFDGTFIELSDITGF